jgi:hypothetical protein
VTTPGSAPPAASLPTIETIVLGFREVEIMDNGLLTALVSREEVNRHLELA